MTDRELMRQALNALEWNLPVLEDYGDKEQLQRQHKAITALRDRLAQPEQGPVAWMHKETGLLRSNDRPKGADWECNDWQPLYTTPPQRQWTGLTDDEILRLWAGDVPRPVLGKNKVLAFARFIEAQLKQRNT